MDAVDPRDRGQRLVAVAEGGHRNEARGAPQTPVHVGTEIGMVEHALQRVGMEHLQQQGADPAGHHSDKIGMNQADRGVAGEQRRVRRRGGGLSGAGIMEHAAHPLDEAETQRFDRIGHGTGYRRAAAPRPSASPNCQPAGQSQPLQAAGRRSNPARR